MDSINLDSLKRLATRYSQKVTHFCRSAARLSGMIALREQFNLKTDPGIGMGKEDERELQKRIVGLANVCKTTLVRLNENAVEMGIDQPLPGAEELKLSEIVDVCLAYTAALSLVSDYQSWLSD